MVRRFEMKRKITVFLVVGLAGCLAMSCWGQRQAAPVEVKPISERLYEIAGRSDELERLREALAGLERD